MPDLIFNTPAGQTVQRELLLLCLNTADASASAPVWSPVGSRVTDSSEEIDWSAGTSTDITGKTRTDLKKPSLSQTFDPLPLDAGDPAVVKLWNLAVKEQNYPALANMDVLIVHRYAGTAGSAMFAERYDGSAVEVTGLGGEGGGTISMPITVTPGGTRTTGTAAIDDTTGAITFTADGATAPSAAKAVSK